MIILTLHLVQCQVSCLHLSQCRFFLLLVMSVNRLMCPFPTTYAISKWINLNLIEFKLSRIIIRIISIARQFSGLMLKLVRTPLNNLLRGFENYLSLSLCTYITRMDVMLDFICMGPVDLTGARRKRQNTK